MKVRQLGQWWRTMEAKRVDAVIRIDLLSFKLLLGLWKSHGNETLKSKTKEKKTWNATQLKETVMQNADVWEMN